MGWNSGFLEITKTSSAHCIETDCRCLLFFSRQPWKFRTPGRPVTMHVAIINFEKTDGNSNLNLPGNWKSLKPDKSKSHPSPVSCGVGSFSSSLLLSRSSSILLSSSIRIISSSIRLLSSSSLLLLSSSTIRSIPIPILFISPVDIPAQEFNQFVNKFPCLFIPFPFVPDQLLKPFCVAWALLLALSPFIMDQLLTPFVWLLTPFRHIPPQLSLSFWICLLVSSIILCDCSLSWRTFRCGENPFGSPLLNGNDVALENPDPG